MLLVQLLDHLQEETEESKGGREGRNCLTSRWRNIPVAIVEPFLKGNPELSTPP